MDFDFTASDLIEQGRTTQEAIDEINTWMSNCDDLPNIPDEMVVLFLLSCNNEIEFTQKTIQSYYKCKKNAPEIFDDRECERKDIELALTTVKMASIPKRTEDNSAIHFFRLDDGNYNNFELVPIMKASYMLLDVTQQKNPPDGLIVIIDMKQFGLMHLTRLKIGAIRKYITFLQDAFPVQLKVIHILNAVYFFDKVMAILKTVMNSQLVDMLKVHSPNINMDEFYQKYVPVKYLPSDYGGDLPSLEKLHDVTMDKLRKRQPFFDAEERIRKTVK